MTHIEALRDDAKRERWNSEHDRAEWFAREAEWYAGAADDLKAKHFRVDVWGALWIVLGVFFLSPSLAGPVEALARLIAHLISTYLAASPA
jgi:hypothetical protein